MKAKTMKSVVTSVVAVMSLCAFATDPLDVSVPGSDPNSEPCTPTQRTDEYGVQHFNDDRSQSQGKSFDAVLFGDSITDFWVYSNLSYDGSASKTINMGIGSDRVQHLLWRVRNGALDGYTTEYFTLLIGVNNGYQKHVDNHSDPCDRAEDVAESIRLILKEIVTKHPDAKILLMPILPYGFDSRYYPALDVRNVNEDINDYIIKFVDYKHVFWVDLRSQYLNSDATCKKSVFGGPGGNYDAVGHYLHPHTDSYPVIWKPALTNAMQRYRAVAAGQPHVAEPSVGYASAAQFGYDHSATITVCGILTGTDANADPVETYSISYKLDDGPWTVALQDQSRSVTRNSFVIPDVALGDHSCQVRVTTADNKVLSTLIDFTMYDGWTGAPLPSDDSAVRTDGTLAYAYACGNYTVNGVSFSGSIDSANISWPFSATSGSQAPSSVASGGYRELLNHCWWANAGDKEMTLKNLTPGHNYLVQIFGYRDYSGHDKSHVWIKESYRDANYMKILGDGWECGGALTGVFTATAETKAITISGDNNWAVNGIQVRDLGESGAPVVVKPKIGSTTVTTNETTASVFLSGIVMGTDDAGTNATSYAVSCSLNGEAAVTVLQNQTEATASFDLENLADGEYTCVVTITTDKNKTAEATVNFRIGEPPEQPPTPTPTTGWTSGPMASDGSTIRTDGTLVYAYSVLGGTVGGVAFTRATPLSDASMVSASPAAAGSKYGDFIAPSGASGDFGKMLSHGWYWEGEEGSLSFTLTLMGLTAGRTYLVQLVSHRTSNSTTVSANGSTPVYIHGTHDNVDYTYGASIVGIFVAAGATANITVTYPTGSGNRPLNAIQVRDLGESGGGGGGDDPVEPVDPVDPAETPIYTLTIPAKTGLTLGSVTTNGVAVALANNACSIVSNTTVTINFTAASGYEIVSGNPLIVTVTANKTLADGEYPVVQEQGGSGGGDEPGPEPGDGWTATPMGATSASIRTDGTLLYAYARGNYTANGVAFVGSDSIINNENCVVWEATGGAQTLPPSAPSDTEEGGYKDLLQHAWWATAKGRKIALKNLEGGKRYLVQIISFRNDGASHTATAPSGDQTIHFGGTGWEYGGSLIGIFTASGTSEEFTIQYSGSACINGIQVRELPADEPVEVDTPVIGGDGVDVPFAVSSDKVSITIGNAAAGHTYGYKKSATIEGLADATTVWLTSPESAGALTLEIDKDSAEPTCFYQVVVSTL